VKDRGKSKRDSRIKANSRGIRFQLGCSSLRNDLHRRPLQIETFVGEFIFARDRLIVNGQKRRGPVQSADKISTILLARPGGESGRSGRGECTRSRARARFRSSSGHKYTPKVCSIYYLIPSTRFALGPGRTLTATCSVARPRPKINHRNQPDAD